MLRLRRPTEELTPEERNKIMGHRKGDSSTYLTYYMSNFIDRDCQSICFGSTPQQDLIHLAARLQRHDAAPTCLTEEELAEINEDDDLKALRLAKANAVQAWKDLGYRSREAAAGTTVRQDYDRYSREAENLSKYLKAIRLRQVLERFHTNVHVEEIDRQLRGIKPADIIAPPSIAYDLSERAHVAKSYAAAAEVTGAEQLHELRLELIGEVSRLCGRQESRAIRETKRKLTRGTGQASPLTDAGGETDGEKRRVRPRRPNMADRTPDRDETGLICAFCRWHGHHGSADRTKTWQMRHLVRHLKSMHLNKLKMPFLCPWQDCEAILGSREHFASHSQEHGQDLQASVFR